jgi:hypothetical protein
MRKSFEDEVMEFADDIVITGVFRNRIASWSSPRKKINLQVFTVTAMGNEPGSVNYDPSVRFINGCSYEVHYNGEVYTADFESQVKQIIKQVML